MSTVPPSVTSLPLLEELEWRGLLHQTTEGCAESLAQGPVTGYCGFDPTAESLHVGNLVSIMGLVRLARAGHHAIALVGGGTAMIGDPSGKAEERPMRSAEEIAANAKLIEAQLRRIAAAALGDAAADRFRVRDNAAWLGSLHLIEFLRDVDKHFTVNWMMQKDSVKSRLDGGISFTEFSYMLLQAYDFLKLNEMEGVTLQIGGSDQWGNITAGTELIRRTAHGRTVSAPTAQTGRVNDNIGASARPEAHGLTFPLLTDAAGKKFGKTEAGAVWLDAGRTTPYQFYQFWINSDDADVGRLLRTFTLLGRSEIEAIEAAHTSAPHERGAQKRLAHEVTTLVHGAEAAALAETVSRTVFDKKADVSTLSEQVFTVLAAEMPSVQLARGEDGTVDMLAALEGAFALSRTAARKLIQQGAVSVNGSKLGADETTVPASEAVLGRWLVVRKGGRDIAVAEIGPPPRIGS
ncbi:MAG TPA: tyrosine--tRNA ligase [Gemmatimonadaceae bacterium]|nr:tyrosine--tRNA ligase [Gemmatimonadaceae bacterium]